MINGISSQRSRMTSGGDSGADLITATKVGGLSLAYSYLSDAEAYLAAARRLDEGGSQFSPKYFLLCHAIELALKAYILAKGGTEGDIKKIRHDLVAALSRAIDCGFQPANAKLREVIQRVASPHADYSFRYGGRWTHILPRAEVFDAAVSGLIKDVSSTVIDNSTILRIT